MSPEKKKRATELGLVGLVTALGPFLGPMLNGHTSRLERIETSVARIEERTRALPELDARVQKHGEEIAALAAMKPK